MAHRNKVEKLSEVLLQKETIDIIEIVDTIGERPFPLPKSISNYIEEIKKKRQEDEEKVSELKEEREIGIQV